MENKKNRRKVITPGIIYIFIIMIILIIVLIKVNIFFGDYLEARIVLNCEISKIEAIGNVFKDIEHLEEHKILCQNNCSYFFEKIKEKEETIELYKSYDCERFYRIYFKGESSPEEVQER